jgi:hypothetical protein
LLRGGAFPSGYDAHSSGATQIPIHVLASMITGNIGPLEQRKRRIFGVMAFAAACGWAITGRASSLVGGIVRFALLWFGALGIYQLRKKPECCLPREECAIRNLELK